MKHIGRQILVILASALLLTGCGQEVHYMTRKEKVLQIIEEKGADEVTWSDFSFLNHYNSGSGIRVERYDLGDGDYLELCGVSLKEKPWTIFLKLDGREQQLKFFSESDASDPAP